MELFRQVRINPAAVISGWGNSRLEIVDHLHVVFYSILIQQIDHVIRPVIVNTVRNSGTAGESSTDGTNCSYARQ